MTSIPEDVKSGAYASAPADIRVLAGAICAAILAERLAERERCGKIADELWKARAASNLSPTEAARLTAQSIASSIRSQSLSDKE